MLSTGTQVTLPDPATGEAPGNSALPRTADWRRFAFATVVGEALVAGPWLWVITSLWGPFDILRKTTYEDNFYSLQARAMLHGHLWLSSSIGIEGFIHAGREYTYFGLFPSLLRMPVLLFTHRLDSLLTTPSMIIAWVVTATVVPLVLWRVRGFVRGPAVLGRAEAISWGALAATIMGGSVLVFLAAVPYVFDEDLAWSVALTISCIFALLGILENPSRRRIAWAGLAILAAELDRTTTGGACVFMALAIAVWFRLGRAGEDKRRWFGPILAAALVPFCIGMAVNALKFGTPIGLPVADQVWSHVNWHRELFLRFNHNSEIAPEFAPSAALAYFRPDGIRFTSAFPFITLPGYPAPSVFGVLFDRRYPTASLPASMPLLFLLSCWGALRALRRRPPGLTAYTRIPLLFSAAAGFALLGWGYLATRYLADFVPFLVIASAVGLADLWRKTANRRTMGLKQKLPMGRFLLGGVLAGTVASILINFAIAVGPDDEWIIGSTGGQARPLEFVRAQKAFTDALGGDLRSDVRQGWSLPQLGPVNELFVVGDCEGLYISDGDDVRTVPNQLYQRASWLAVQRGPGFDHTFSITVNRAQPLGQAPVPLVYADHSAIVLSAFAEPNSSLIGLTFYLDDPTIISRFPELKLSAPLISVTTAVRPGTTHSVDVVTDNADHTALVSIDGSLVLDYPMTGGTAGVAQAPRTAPPHAQASALTVVDTTPTTPPDLCANLLGH